MCCMSVCLSVCLFVGSSLAAPLPRLISRSSLEAASTTIMTAIVVTITQVSKPSRSVNPPRILGHLQLEIPSKPDKLLKLLYSGLKFEMKTMLEQVLRDARKGKTRMKENSLLMYP